MFQKYYPFYKNYKQGIRARLHNILCIPKFATLDTELNELFD